MHSIFKCVWKNIGTVKKYNYVFYCTITPTKRPGTYTVKPVEKQDEENVMKLLKKTFHTNEPLNAAVGLISSENDTCPELDEYCRSSLLDGLSFKAVDSNDNVVGVTISGISPMASLKCISNQRSWIIIAGNIGECHRFKYPIPTFQDTGKNLLANAQCCKNPKFQKILFILAKQSTAARLSEKYPRDQSLVEIKVAATDACWTKRGIMNALVGKTVEAAEHKKIRLLRMDATSAYSAMSAKRLGFTCVHKTLYTDIKMDGRPIIVPEPPHLEYRIYIKELCVM